MKRLSHRCRGFDVNESSLDGFVRALETAEGVELDTRATRDGVLVVTHDRFLKGPDGRVCAIDQVDHDDLARIAPHISTLGEFLAVFSEHAAPTAELMLDIKGAQHCDEHLRLARQYLVLNRVTFISWRPESLLDLVALDSNVRLGFSHVPLRGGLLSDGISRVLEQGHVQRIAGAAIGLVAPRLGREIADMVVRGRADPSDRLDPGNVGVVSVGPSAGRLMSVLRDRNAMVLTPILTSRSTLERYTQWGLSIGLFTAKTLGDVSRATTLGAHVLLCDNPQLFSQDPD